MKDKTKKVSVIVKEKNMKNDHQSKTFSYSERFYKIYGLNVRSQLHLQGAALATEGEAAVRIACGKVPDFLKKAGELGYGTWTNGFTSAWFRVRDGTQIYVEGGRHITVEPAFLPDMTLVSSLLLSAGMALICLQRGEPFLHGSALVVRGQAILLCGESGAGKSTVATQLLQQGAGLLADDTVRIHGESEMVAEPSYPQQKLCRDVALRCGQDLEELRYIDEERDKYAWLRTDCYVEKAQILKKIFLLRKSAVGSGQTEAVRVRELTGQEALEVVSAQLYLSDTYRHITGIPLPLMEQLIRITAQTQILEVTRQEQGDTVQEVVTKILQFC